MDQIVAEISEIPVEVPAITDDDIPALHVPNHVTVLWRSKRILLARNRFKRDRFSSVRYGINGKGMSQREENLVGPDSNRTSHVK
ncbi:MAG: hypothetical protein IKH09_03395 [Clostridia bacterium]|nr:hypothetical protein [Clostridia bacterium]